MTTTTMSPALTIETETTHEAASARAGAVSGGPRVLLRAEGALLMIATVAAYRMLGGGWGMLAALFLVPDVSLLGYLAGPRVGAAIYNAAHSTIGPALLGALAVATGMDGTLAQLALIWAAHVGFDRMMGYGLKYATRFGATHLGQIGTKA